RLLGKTGMRVSEVSFGTWAMGSAWGKVDDKESMAALNKAVDLGVNFFDTADVYGDGRSEKLLGQLLKDRKETIYVATKAGRKLQPHTAEKYTPLALKRFVEDSIKKLRVDALDLLQLHCPPWEVYYNQEVFTCLDDMVKAGKLKNYGVSVEKVEEALKAIEYPGVKTVQIIFNMFRQRPAELFFREARARWIGVLARVPLASGLLTGKMTRTTKFGPDDHRNFNRKGQAFDQGETFSGVDYAKGLQAVEDLKKILPRGMTLSQFALKWILMHPAVSCVIPGAKTPAQVEENAKTVSLPRLPRSVMRQVEEVYNKYVRDGVHARW
ncbi:MAG TPA: aldo/keto reductase, partial [Spirochaetia bacterium]|nr:aldo/keto reductase [Spirochaetia bacterium]